MNLLVIDTSTTRALVALRHGARLDVGDEGQLDPGGRHGRRLVPVIAGLLTAAGMTPRNLDAVAVGLGPGSYTGLRVGLTAAKTLAFTLGKPLVGIDSYAAIARNAPTEARTIHVVGDAQRGDLYVADFARSDSDDSPVSLGPIRVVEAAGWAGALPPEVCVLGPALDRLRVTWPDHARLGSADQGHPAPAALVAIALEAVRSGRFADPHLVEPTYIRRSAAEDQWDRRG